MAHMHEWPSMATARPSHCSRARGVGTTANGAATGVTLNLVGPCGAAEPRPCPLVSVEGAAVYVARSMTPY